MALLSMTNSFVSLSRNRICCHGMKWNDRNEKAGARWHTCCSLGTAHKHLQLQLASQRHLPCPAANARTQGLNSFPSVAAARRRAVIARGFFTQLFGKRSTDVQLSDRIEDMEHTEFDDLEDGEELVLTETTREDGSVASIVYRIGGFIDAAEVDVLCAKVCWPRRQIHKVATALRKSYLVCHIHLCISYPDKEAPKERLIGMARATSDHAFNATIWDVIVDPEYQGRGLGKCLVEQMVRALLRRDITNISLFADARAIRFYERLGFETDPDGIKGMFWYPPR